MFVLNRIRKVVDFIVSIHNQFPKFGISSNLIFLIRLNHARAFDENENKDFSND